ncbi:MAG: hypothetical protein ABI175_12405 [Polyangiales bacterium]
MNPQFVQIPCVKCGATVWISPAAGVGYCPSCHTPNNMPAGGAPQAQPYGQPGVQQPMQQPMGQGQPAPQVAPVAMSPMAFRQPKKPPMGLIIGGVLLAIVGSVGFSLFKSFIFKKPGHASAKDIGISDPKKADLDQIIAGTKTLAQKWRGNAQFFAVTANGVNPDGTVDLTDGNVIVKYISVGNKVDSTKEFILNGDDVTYDKVWDTTRAWVADDVTPLPECTAGKLAKALKKEEGWKSGKGQFIIDPEDTDRPAWHVNISGGAKVTDFFDLETCEKLKVDFAK